MYSCRKKDAQLGYGIVYTALLMPCEMYMVKMADVLQVKL